MGGRRDSRFFLPRSLLHDLLVWYKGCKASCGSPAYTVMRVVVYRHPFKIIQSLVPWSQYHDLCDLLLLDLLICDKLGKRALPGHSQVVWDRKSHTEAKPRVNHRDRLLARACLRTHWNCLHKRVYCGSQFVDLEAFADVCVIDWLHLIGHLAFHPRFGLLLYL